MSMHDGRIANPICPRRVDSWLIGDKMRDARSDAERTQGWVARQLYVSVRTIREWESGRRKPTVDMLDAYLKLLGASITLGVPS